MYNIAFIFGEALAATLFTGTFLLFLIKGFINPKANWLYIYTGCFMVLTILFYMSYPETAYDNPLFNAINGLLFFGGIAGAIKYYWKRRSATNTHS